MVAAADGEGASRSTRRCSARWGLPLPGTAGSAAIPSPALATSTPAGSCARHHIREEPRLLLLEVSASTGGSVGLRANSRIAAPTAHRGRRDAAPPWPLPRVCGLACCCPTRWHSSWLASSAPSIQQDKEIPHHQRASRQVGAQPRCLYMSSGQSSAVSVVPRYTRGRVSDSSVWTLESSFSPTQSESAISTTTYMDSMYRKQQKNVHARVTVVAAAAAALPCLARGRPLSIAPPPLFFLFLYACSKPPTSLCRKPPPRRSSPQVVELLAVAAASVQGQRGAAVQRPPLRGVRLLDSSHHRYTARPLNSDR